MSPEGGSGLETTAGGGVRESVSVEMGTVGGNGEVPINDKGMMTFNCEGLSVQGKEVPLSPKECNLHLAGVAQ